MNDVTLIYADEGDWVGLYIDGELREQGHSLSESDVLSF